MRIISLNTGGGRLFPELADWVRRTEADVWCFQEVTRAPDGGPSRLDFVDGTTVLPQRTDLFDDLVAVLPDHDGLFAPAASGELVDDEDRAFLSDFGLASFVHRAIPVFEQRVCFIHGAYSAGGWGEHPRPRNAHAMRLHDRAAGGPVTIVQLHGLRDPDGKADTPARSAQARAIRDLVESTRGSPDEPTVVCGDFNLLPGSETFGILAAIGLTDLVTTRGFTDTRTSHYPKPVRHANYMFVNAAAKAGSFDVVEEPEVSDHRPMVLELP